jgi:hypothetical protein
VCMLRLAFSSCSHRTTRRSSLVHAAIIAVQAFQNASERGHLMSDVPALIIVGIALIVLAPAKQSA